MKHALMSVLIAVALGSPAFADPPMQPPMNNFDQAFYTCDNGGAFIVSYEGNPPTSATMTTSNDNKSYALKRTPAATGAQFAGAAGAKFWTDGKTVTVAGTQKAFINCKIKPG
jgi:membrane-bound inhibitor of C-type lysozyme